MVGSMQSLLHRCSDACCECPRSERGLSWSPQFVHGFQASWSVASASCCAYFSRGALWPNVVLRKPEEECCVLPVVQLLFLRLLLGVQNHPETVSFIVACDPRCKSERVGSSRSDV